jgi:RNA-directed DNA polymerase
LKWKKRNFRFVRYADDFSIYCKTKAEARNAGNGIYIFLRDKLKLPVNKGKSGIRRPVNFQILGFGFVPIYKTGVKGKYQLIVTKQKWKECKQKLKDITRKTKPMSFDERIKELNNFINGWIESKKYANIKSNWLNWTVGSVSDYGVAYGTIGRDLKGRGKISFG